MPVMDVAVNVLMIVAIIGYLLGTIPSGVLLARVMGLGDLRKVGSGNIGATNVLRTGNKKAAALTLIFDALKGAAAVAVGYAMGGEVAAQVAALAALVGHCFPIWLKFRGGKGVATYFGVIFALAWPAGLAAGAIWLLTAAVSRYSSLAALMTAGWTPIAAVLVAQGQIFILGCLLGLLIYGRHWGNIQRLRKGTETKIGSKTAKS
ncbi:glycerol-3-phosphate 1-O-acyltransferase PlsY [Yoonia sp. R2331]|uniref:glycerol-3-phosphate 1-O-acyltransferase PlsY n=1 Tax=Yoonia sp. R2331 TaxID=3237238 RepID=UPI0034E4EADB